METPFFFFLHSRVPWRAGGGGAGGWVTAWHWAEVPPSLRQGIFQIYKAETNCRQKPEGVLFNILVWILCLYNNIAVWDLRRKQAGV